MKLWISAATLLFSAQASFAVESIQLDCQWTAPTCWNNAASAPPGGTAGGVDFEGLRSPDQQIGAEVSLLMNAGRLSSVMTVQLTDLASGKLSPLGSFTIQEHSTVLGGVENFKASSGQLYTLICQGSMVEPGDNIPITPCN